LLLINKEAKEIKFKDLSITIDGGDQGMTTDTLNEGTVILKSRCSGCAVTLMTISSSC
jgi:hypothetical protein